MNKIQKQEILIQNILDKIGGPENIGDAYHCATRLRLSLKNEEIVKIEDIKFISNIKGALWSNGELQIIIGAEVSQITDLLKKTISNVRTKNNDKETNDFVVKNIKNQKISIHKKFLKSVSAIFGPLIPFLIGVGLIMALQQLLIRTGAASSIEEGGVLGIDYNIFWLCIECNCQFRI